ncbi:alpha/beta hydrolase family protein [Angustibacter aerolatus]
MGRAVAGAAAGCAALGFAGAGVVATYFTRRVLTPDRRRPDDVVVHDVDLAVDPQTVTLGRTDETAEPGRYGLWLPGGGHARVGEVLRRDDDLVVRELLGVDAGELRAGPARWNQYHFAGTPRSALGLDFDDVEVPAELGGLPAWLVPGAVGAGGATSGDWAVLVHGRGATREECLRTLPLLHRRGVTALVPAYRNDPDAPADPAGRYGLGDSEWRDVEDAVRWAVQHGAERVLLMGWSMGGAIVLQAATRSTAARVVVGVVLDAPVVDWHAVLDHQSAAHHVPPRVARIGHVLMRHRLGRRLVGLEQPLDLRRLDWVTRAAELELPVLIVHSDADEYVPNGPSLALAAARPDVVRAEPWQQGRHTKEWNTDPARWEAVVGGFVDEVLSRPAG